MLMSSISHNDLVSLAAKWLRKHHEQNAVLRNCSVVVEEMRTATNEIPDVLGFSGLQSVMIEVKITRADFLSDFKKPFRENPKKGIGDMRLYCTPKGLIAIEELPDCWGLLEYDSGRLSIAKMPIPQDRNEHAERICLLSIIRRLKDNQNDEAKFQC